jgi:AraC-like DNA-binding protein
VDARIGIFLRIIEERGGILATASNEIARLLGLGKPHLLRLFRKEMGKTLRRHLLEVRMTRAARLLRYAALPIKTISSQCGYTLVSNFHRDFKVVHRMTPAQMRFKHMNSQSRENLPDPIDLSLSAVEFVDPQQVNNTELMPSSHKRTV